MNFFLAEGTSRKRNSKGQFCNTQYYINLILNAIFIKKKNMHVGHYYNVYSYIICDKTYYNIKHFFIIIECKRKL